MLFYTLNEEGSSDSGFICEQEGKVVLAACYSQIVLSYEDAYYILPEIKKQAQNMVETFKTLKAKVEKAQKHNKLLGNKLYLTKKDDYRSGALTVPADSTVIKLRGYVNTDFYYEEVKQIKGSRQCFQSELCLVDMTADKSFEWNFYVNGKHDKTVEARIRKLEIIIEACNAIHDHVRVCVLNEAFAKEEFNYG